MLEFLKNLLGFDKTDYKELLREGAVILDVRSKREYESGHISGSVNISLDILSNNLKKLKNKNIPVITCCATGLRSASAMRILKTNGYLNVHNGGGWQNLDKKTKN